MEIRKRIQEIQTKIYLNQDCYNEIYKQIVKLITKENGTLTMICGDEENELDQIIYQIQQLNTQEIYKNYLQLQQRFLENENN